MSADAQTPQTASASADAAKLSDKLPPEVKAKLDAEFITYLDEVESQRKPAEFANIDDVRKHAAEFEPPWYLDTTGRERVTDYDVESMDGIIFPVKVYHPDPKVYGDGPYPVHLNFHGGGFVLGNLKTEARICLNIVENTGVAVIDVNYRHCPEAPWGKCIEDAWTSIHWAEDQAKKLNINPDSMSIGGISAGAHISLVLQHMTHEAGIPLKLVIASVTPSVDGLTYTTYEQSPYPSFKEFAKGAALNWDRIKWFGELCFPRDKMEQLRGSLPEWWLAPIKAKSWNRLPDTVILTAECDPLRDEGEAYAAKLVETGNKVTVKRFLGMPHTFVYMTSLTKKREWDVTIVKAIKAAHTTS